MPDMNSPITTALITRICGTLVAMVVSFFSRQKEQAPHQRAVEPYVGFLFGSIIGAVGVMGWRVILW